MALDKVIDQQSKTLGELEKNSKQDKIIQLLQLYEENKIDKEDQEHLDKVKETNKLLDKVITIDASMAKDVKKVVESVSGAKKLEEIDTLKELKESISRLAKTLEGHQPTQKNEKIESANKPFAGTKVENVPVANRLEQNLDERLERRDTFRQNTGSGLRNLIYGEGSKGQGGMFENFLSKREDKIADKRLEKQEKREFVSGAMENDAGTIGVTNLKGKGNIVQRIQGQMAGKKYATAKFEALKDKENEIVEARDAIKSSTEAGYAPKVKDIKAEQKAKKELFAMDDPREKSQVRADERAEKAAAKEDKRTEKVQARESVIQPVSSTSFSQTSEEKEENKAERAKFEADTVATEGKQVEEFHGMGATLIASLEVHKSILEAIKAGGTGGGGSGSSLLGDAADLASNFMGKGKGLLGRAGGFISRVAPKALNFAKGAAIAAAGGYVIDAGFGKLGIGKDEKGEDIKVDEKKDDENWDKSSFLEKAQSSIPRGIEKVGKLFFLDNLSRQAKADRIKAESEYFDKKEGKVPGEKTTTVKGEMETLMGTVVEKGKPLTPEQMNQVKLNMDHGIEPTPLVKEAYEATLKQPKAEGSGTAGAIENKTAELNNIKDSAANKGGSNNIVSAPTTNITNSNIANNQTRVPVRSEENSMNRYIGNRYAAY